MMLAKTSAPGKVIVAGEYAVLDGAPAICMAVNRRARVSISLNDETEHVVSAPGFLEKPQRFASMTDCADTLPLLSAVWSESGPAIDGRLNIDIDSREFVAANGRKMGIGSSAAVAVALAAAIEQMAAGGRDIRETAMAAHRNFQGGSGSGADIACSHAGGVIVYRREEKISQLIAWPADLYFALLSAKPVNTRSTRSLCGYGKETEQAGQLRLARFQDRAGDGIGRSFAALAKRGCCEHCFINERLHEDTIAIRC